MSARNEELAARGMLQVDPRWDAARVERSLLALHRRKRRRSAVKASAAGAFVSLAAAVVGVFTLQPPEAVEPVAAIATAAVPEVDERRTTLADGTTIERFDDAEAVVQEPREQEVRVRLATGRLRLNVTPRKDRVFVVEAGAFSAQVLGTRFDVLRDGQRVLVTVEEGHVRVLRSDGSVVRDLLTGQSGTFDANDEVLDGTDDAVDAGGDAAASAAETRGSAVPDNPKIDKSSARLPDTGEQDWRPLARQGVYDEAYELIKQAGQSAVRDSVEDLLLAADAARLSGHPAQALPYLEKVITKYPGDGRAALSAFTKGRVLLSLGRAGDAASAFERALALGASGSLRENALARAVEAHARAGSPRKETLARSYVSQYPQGRWLAAVKEHGGLTSESQSD